jgi:biotin transport system permease protein
MNGLYHYPPSWLHKISAGIKLLALALLSIAVMVTSHIAYLAIGFTGVCIIYVAIIFLGQFWISGIDAALASTIRLTLMILLADLVTMSTPMQAMMDVFSRLLTPARLAGFNTDRISFCIALMIRFVPLLLELWRQQSEAWRARTGKRAGWRLIAPFLANVMRMADRMAESLDARGFGMAASARHESSGS